MQTLYTDYPFIELGDIPHEEAPIREVVPLTWDDNKYCDVLVGGIVSNIKAGYIYTESGRCGDVPTFDPDSYFIERMEQQRFSTVDVGMQIRHKWYHMEDQFHWTAMIIEIKEDENELVVQILNGAYGKRFETWNLAHTKSGLNMGEYRRVRK